MKALILLCLVCIVTFGACSNKSEDDINFSANDINDNTDADTTSTNAGILKILALGDSYTIGQSVCETCRFPVQLKDSLVNDLNTSDISLDIIAQTGWTTTNLINAIAAQNLASDYDLVTLLIGVNNQYQHKSFDVYTNEFPVLIQKATAAVNGDKSKIILISIPDYAFTPFGQNSSNPEIISTELDQYNDFARTYCEERDITFVNITDITRLGLEQPNLVASDGLHPSEIAYSKFVERLLPFATEKLQ